MQQRVMQQNAERTREREEMHLLDHTPSRWSSYDDGPEFSSDPMPAAFSVCLFLGFALGVCALIALFW